MDQWDCWSGPVWLGGSLWSADIWTSSGLPGVAILVFQVVGRSVGLRLELGWMLLSWAISDSPQNQPGSSRGGFREAKSHCALRFQASDCITLLLSTGQNKPRAQTRMVVGEGDHPTLRRPGMQGGETDHSRKHTWLPESEKRRLILKEKIEVLSRGLKFWLRTPRQRFLRKWHIYRSDEPLVAKIDLFKKPKR